MKQKYIDLGKALIIIVMNHMLFIAIATTMMGMFQRETPQTHVWVLLGLVPVLLYFVRVHIGNFLLFFGIHFLVVGVMLFMPVDGLVKVLLVVLTAGYSVWSIKVRYKSKDNNEDFMIPLFMIPAIAALSMVYTVYTPHEWEALYLTLALIYMGLYFIYYFLNKFQYFMQVNESSAANIPEKEIFSSGMKQTCIFAGAGLLLLVLTANVGWVSFLTSWLGVKIKELLRKFFSGFELPDIAYDPTDPWTQMGDPTAGMPATYEKSAIWLIIEKALLALIGIVLVCMLILLIMTGIRTLWRVFHTTRSPKERVLHGTRDIREVLAVETRKKRETAGGNKLGFLNNRDKVRRFYRKQVLKNKADIIGERDKEELAHYTARECCEKFAADDLQIVYEKARYSLDEITSEDVKFAKASVK